MTNLTTDATATAVKPIRRRGIVRLDENLLDRLLVLPDGQRIIGFRNDPMRMCIEVGVEGDGLPECQLNAEPQVVDAEPYTVRFSRWAMRGRDLEEMIEALADLCAVKGGLDAEVDVASDLRAVLAGEYDPRTDVR
jgi:hypothetical protein